MIEPRTLKGFRDFLPKNEIKRKNFISKIEHHFSSHGFVPIDTPILEYADILLSKTAGETEKQIYRFCDQGGRDVAMRFDLTVPFARFTAQHKDKDLTLPFSRYHIAKVWRGENSQKGRYREFYQCDIDTIGSTDPISDAEILNTLYEALSNILEGKNFIIKISHRQFLSSLLKNLNIKEKENEVLHIVDKFKKIPKEEFISQLSNLVGQNNSKKIIELINIDTNKSFETSVLEAHRLTNSEVAKKNLLDIYSLLNDNIKKYLILDTSIARGLDYYTGMVFETFIQGEDIGSISSGGRYDNLASHFSKETISGVGGSIGLDRLLSTFEENDESLVQIVALKTDTSDDIKTLKFANVLRSNSYSVYAFPCIKKTKQELEWVQNSGAKVAYWYDNDSKIHIKNIQNHKEEITKEEKEAIAIIKKIIK